jgi:phage shock protein A
MGIFSRMSDIISANINDMVDGIEDPEKLLKQAVREMENTIEQAKESTAKTMAGQQMLKRELEKNRQQAKLWTSRAETAVADSNDDLARKAIARKQEHEKLVVALEDEIAESEQTIQRLRHQLSAMNAKLAEAKRRLTTLSARKRVADLRIKMNEVSEGASSGGSAFAKFDRMREKVEMAEAQANAMHELTNDPNDNMDINLTTEKEAVSAEVEAELAALKKKTKP